MSSSSSSSSSSTPTSATTPTRKGGDKDKGFFNKIRFRRSSSDKKIPTTPTTKKSQTPTKNKNKMNRKKTTTTKEAMSKSKANNNHTNTTIADDEPILLTRRVIKATRPPSPTTAMDSMVVTSTSDQGTVDTSLSSSADDRSERPQLLGKDENLREKTEQFRMDRLENAAAIRKENKEKEVMQHRLGGGKASKENAGGDDAVSGKGKGGEKKLQMVEMEVSDIFKTQTFHPEHKRKVSSDIHADETEKKTKLDDTDGKAFITETTKSTTTEENEDTTKAKAIVVKKTWSTALSGWITAAAPATVFAACAFMMMRVMRKR